MTTYQDKVQQARGEFSIKLTSLMSIIEGARECLDKDPSHPRFRDATVKVRRARRYAELAEAATLERLARLDTFDTLLEEKEGTTKQGDTPQC